MKEKRWLYIGALLVLERKEFRKEGMYNGIKEFKMECTKEGWMEGRNLYSPLKCDDCVRLGFDLSSQSLALRRIRDDVDLSCSSNVR